MTDLGEIVVDKEMEDGVETETQTTNKDSRHLSDLLLGIFASMY